MHIAVTTTHCVCTFIYQCVFMYCGLQIDMEDIKAKFLEMYHKTLGKFIEGDCSGDYKRMLLALVGPN